jgi:excisionase family DNA binding protein
MEHDLLTVEQVATILQVHWQSVLNYIKRGDLVAVRLGRGYRIERKDLDKFLNERSTREEKV